MRGRALGRGTLRKREAAGEQFVFQAEFRDANGNRRRIDLGSDRRTAERRLADLIRQRDLIRQGMGTEEAQSLPLEQLAAAYLRTLAASVKPHRVAAVDADLKELFKDLNAQRVGQVKAEAVLELRAKWVRHGKRSNATINRKLGALRSLLRWALHSRIIGSNPLDGINRLPTGRAHEKRPRRPLTEEEVTRFLAAAEKVDAELEAHHAAERTVAGGTKGTPYAERPRLPYIPQAHLFRALLLTGARVGELVAVTWADVDRKARLLTIRASTTKTARGRIIPLRGEVLDDLRRLQAIHESALGRLPAGGDSVFLSPMGAPWGNDRANLLRRLHGILDRAGIDKRDAHGRSVGIHSLRHTAGTMLARAGASLIHAQKILGHADPKMTAALYVHTEAEDLRGAIDLLPNMAAHPAKKRPRKARPDATSGH